MPEHVHETDIHRPMLMHMLQHILKQMLDLHVHGYLLQGVLMQVFEHVFSRLVLRYMEWFQMIVLQ